MVLLSLSDELMLQIVESLNAPSDINRLARTCKHLFYKVNPILYYSDRVLNHNASLIWAAENNVPRTLHHAMSAGTVIADQHLPLLHLAASRGHVDMIACLMQEYNVDASEYDDDGKTALIAAVQYPEAVKQLLVHGADRDQTSVKGESPLFAAIWHGHIDAVALLLENRIEGLSQMESKWNHRRISPLHAAALAGRTDVVLMLLDHGMDPTMADSFDETGGSPLAYALWKVKHDTAKVLLEAGTDPNAVPLGPSWLQSPLHKASSSGNTDFVRLLLQYGAVSTVDPRLQNMPLNEAPCGALPGSVEIASLLLEQGDDINHRGMNGRTALYDAISARNSDVALLLIRSGADISIPDDSGELPLHLATMKGMSEVVEALLERCVDLNSTNRFGQKPLVIAFEHSHPAAAKMFLQNGADVSDVYSDLGVLLRVCMGSGAPKLLQLLLDHGTNALNNGRAGTTLLHVTAQCGQLDAVEFLLQHGADPFARDFKGNTPLHMAARSGKTDIVKYLVEYGVDLCPVNDKNETPLIKALVQNRLETIRYLLEKLPKTELERRASYGYTPLLVAIRFSSPDVIRLFLDLGADINNTNCIGAGPLMVAMENKSEHVANLILSLGNIDINQQDIDSRTVLFMASMRGRDAVVERLVSQHPPLKSNTRDRYGATPLIVAARNGNDKVLSLLLKLDDAPLLDVDVFGHDVFYWASQCGHPAVRELLKPYAQASEVDFEEHDGIEPIEFYYDICCCDVCGRCSTDAAGLPLMQCCRLCIAGYSGRFLVCMHCVDNGETCRDQSHTLETNECYCCGDRSP